MQDKRRDTYIGSLRAKQNKWRTHGNKVSANVENLDLLQQVRSSSFLYIKII